MLSIEKTLAIVSDRLHELTREQMQEEFHLQILKIGHYVK